MKKVEVQPAIESNDPIPDKNTNADCDEKSTCDAEPAPKKQRLSKKEYKKLRSGQNKVSEFDQILFVTAQLFRIVFLILVSTASI